LATRNARLAGLAATIRDNNSETLNWVTAVLAQNASPHGHVGEFLDLAATFVDFVRGSADCESTAARVEQRVGGHERARP
jgi:hypothetical protein